MRGFFSFLIVLLSATILWLFGIKPEDIEWEEVYP